MRTFPIIKTRKEKRYHAMFIFLKELFWNENKPCRKEFFYIVLLLSSLVGIPLLFTIAYTVMPALIAQLGAHRLAAYNQYSVMSSLSNLPGISWHFLVLLGSFLLVRRAIGKRIPIILQVLGGIAVYYFFVSPQTMTYAWLGKNLFYNGDPVIQSMLMLPVLVLKIASLCHLLIGGTILLMTFIKLKAPDSWKGENPFLLNRMDYLYQNFYLGLITFLFGGLILILTLLLNWSIHDIAFRILIGILYFGVLIRSVQIMVRRMRHSRFSAHWLWGLLLICLLVSSPLLIFLVQEENIHPVIGIQRLLGWGLRLAEILILVLLFAPAAKGAKHAKDSGLPIPEKAQTADLDSLM